MVGTHLYKALGGAPVYDRCWDVADVVVDAVVDAV